MISVPNHQLLSNGNKLLIVLVVFAVVFSSCGSSKPVLKDRNTRKNTRANTPKSNGKTSKMKEVNWSVLSEDEYPPISYKKDVDEGYLRLKSVYDVNLLLPLETTDILNAAGRGASIHDDRFLNFYAGARLAIQDLEREGTYLNVQVFDTEKNPSKVNSILQSVNNTADLVIGPYTKNELKEAASYAKRNKVTVVSPWRSVSSSVASENDYFVQLRPNLKQYRTSILDHALTSFRADEILIVGNENNKADKKLIQRFQDILKELNEYSQPLDELLIDDQMIVNGDTIFYHMLNQEFGAPKAIIIPNYLSADEDFVYGLLRRINVEQGENRVAIYGMPIMYDSDKIDFDLYRSLDVRIARSKFVDRTRGEIEDFKRVYYQAYNELPTDAAYEGYDVMYYFGQALTKYGIDFQRHLVKESNANLQASYNIIPTFLDEENSSYGDDLSNLKCFENIHVDMIEYVNNRFQIMRR